MSRCFPFSSTGYTGKSSINDSLIVSIKQHEETETSIPDRPKEKAVSSDPKKDRKRERKEKKKDKKERKERKIDEKQKLCSAVDSEKQKHNEKLFKVDGFGKDSSGPKTSLEVLERSNLTEEHGRPVDPQNVSCSSDSTGNSGKRKRDPSPVSSIQGNGNIIRIRLSSQKRDDPITSQCKVSQPTISQTTVVSKVQEPSQHKLPKPFVSQTAAIPKVQEPLRTPPLMPQGKLFKPSVSETVTIPERQEPALPPQLRFQKDRHLQPTVSGAVSIPKLKQPLRAPLTSSSSPQLVKKLETLPPREDPSTSGRTETKKAEKKKLSSHEKKMLKKETLYNNLFENLVPPTILTQLLPVQDDDDNDDWLFGKKDVERPSKKLRESDDLTCSASASLQPRAHFLSDVGVYALPFTIPF